MKRIFIIIISVIAFFALFALHFLLNKKLSSSTLITILVLYIIASFLFFELFQNFLKTNGILDDLEELGIKDGDTVRVYGWDFEYFK